MTEPIALCRELLANWEENCRDLFEDGPFGPDEADWPSLCGYVFHEVILPLHLVVSAEESLPWLPDRPCERLALRALRRIPEQAGNPRHNGGIGQGAARLPRMLRSLWSIRRRPRQRGGLLAICENAQSLAAGADPFYSGLLPEGTHNCWLSTRSAAPPKAELSFDDALLRAALGPLRQFTRRNKELFGEGCQALARRIQIPGLPGSPALTAQVGAELARCIRYHAHSRFAARILLDQVRPDCVLMYAEYASPQYQLLCEARRLGIRTVAIQHGDLVAGLSPGLLETRLAASQHPDLTLVTGPALAAELHSAGLPPDAVKVTGQLWRGLAQARPNRDPRGPVLVFSQSFLSSACRARFFKSLQQLRGPRLQVKLHPYERHGLPRDLLPPDCELLPAELPAFAAMDGKSAVVGGSSTALLEAWSMGFPVLSIESVGDHIRHPELREALPRVPAGADPSPGLATLLERGPLPKDAIASYYIENPDPQSFFDALAP